MEVKENIVQGASELFMRYGIKSISMDDIARHLSISKKTIYQHFEDKDELVYSVVEMEIKNDVKRLTIITEQSTDILDELMKTAMYMKEHLSNMNPSLLYDLKKYHPKGHAKFREFSKGFLVQKITQSINRGIKEGIFRENINVEMMAIYRMESCEMCFNPEVFASDKFNFEELQRNIFMHFILGLATEKGYKLLQNFKIKPNEN